MLGRRGHLVKRAVHAIPDLEFILEGLEVNVAGAILHRLENDQVHESNDGRFIGEIRKAGGIIRSLRVMRFARHVLIVQILQGISQATAVFGVIFVNEFGNLVRVGHQHLNLLAHHETQFIDDRRIQRIAQRDLQC